MATSITATCLRQCNVMKTGRQKKVRENNKHCIRFPLSPQGIWEWPLPPSPEKRRIQFAEADSTPNRIKSGNATQWFPNALCILKVPELYLGFHYFMGILALDGMQTEINSLLILQGNQYKIPPGIVTALKPQTPQPAPLSSDHLCLID